ncbi:MULTISPECIES: aspartate--ammonia ligase [Clostridium]|uniref:Aspartate--ammonia ligase n=3 Tax=Clostridium TaxID=1485 RepID=A0A0A7FTD5_9CLOT|nr:aspartate--ammonia ligase [Clostridium baratii]AIY82857.1 aspartate--ammonia ligase [Clostridium baratii str. Sullivan]AQM59409.1 aspartate--ammonia ligase [Clostridium baratii]MBS6043344.1 aspartate--ammonia ligase [Clostridium baratii]MBT9831368.1 aspartate--ammonia ligase [Clostridium baratii]STB00243.1 asparagine synthetase AsnA [Clostridium baratii]
MEKNNIIIPKDYKSSSTLIETEVFIKSIKDYFERNLAEELNLIRVSAPLFVNSNSGLNDDLNGVERPVKFDLLASNEDVEIVHSLAKWKRMSLHRYGFPVGKGLYADMNAIRRDEELDNIHSIYVDQWDWELIINKEDRNLEFLKNIVKKIYSVFKNTENYVRENLVKIDEELPEEIFFITSQELEDMYKDLTPKEREDAICKEKGAVFIMQIGKDLASGEKHDGRAPDYDDWNLNGDILFWNNVLDRAIELSSMGIRVDEKSLRAQLKEANCEERENLEFHRALLDGKLPYTIGGGIGQSRICMYFLRKAHIGEVQASVWDDLNNKICEENGIVLL